MQQNKISFDELTSTYTNEAFVDVAQRFFLRNPLQSIMLIDIDNLKSINHTKSRDIGDILICKIASSLYEKIPNAIIGRVDGDEFGVFIPEVQSRQEVENLADRLVLEWRNIIPIKEEMILATLSIGIAMIEAEAHRDHTFDRMFHIAEIALCKSKENGKNQYNIANDTLLLEYQRKKDIKDILQEQINKKVSTFHFQPLINIQTEKVVGFEILARMTDEKYGDISPVEFIPIARKNNLIVEFDKITLKSACDAIRTLKENGIDSIYISVNVSPEFFLTPDFYEQVTSIIDCSGIDTRLLSIELTEETFIDSYEEARQLICRLKEKGINFYLDDFGSGYSNLSRIQELELPVMKMDKSLIDNIDRGRDNLLVKKTIEIAQILNMDVIAEGVETETQLEALRQLNCDLVQGFLLGRPMNFEKMVEFIKLRS